MRALVAAVVISSALHGVAIAWVHTRPMPKPESSRVVTPEPAPIAPADPEPMVVALLDDHTVVSSGPGASPARHTQDGSRARIATAPGAKVETGPPAPKHSSVMAMRQPAIEAGPSGDFMAKFLAHSPPIIDQSIDGVKERLGNERWIANASADEVAAERMKLIEMRDAADNAELAPDGAGTKSEHKTFKMSFNADGTAKPIHDKPNWQWLYIPHTHIPFAATFDISDGMMRSAGIDPYSSYKRKVLDETREERFEAGLRYRKQQLARSRELMQKNLERLLAVAGDPAALKQGLFELWDDCAETGSDELVAGGALARDQLLGYIRTRLPASSEHAFTAAELERMNQQRKSKAVFAPYELSAR